MLIVQKVSFLCDRAKERQYESRFHRKQPLFRSCAVRGRPCVHHQGRRPVCGRGQLDRRGLGHSQVHHRRDGRQLRNDHARDARLCLRSARGQRGYRRGQRCRLRNGQSRPDHVHFADLHAVHDVAQAVRRKVLPFAGGYRRALRFHARRPAVRARKLRDSARFRRLCRRKPHQRPSRAGH